MKDDAVEKVLRGLRTAEAPSGLEGRVLRRLAERGEGQKNVWGWGFGLAGGMALVGVLAWNVGIFERGGREHTSGAKARIEGRGERPEAEALGYLQAKTTADSSTSLRNDKRSSLRKDKQAVLRNDKQASLWNDKQEIAASTHVSEARHGAPGLVAGMESFPAPPEPLTEQERLLVRVARHPRAGEVAFLSAELREVALLKSSAEFDLFFREPEISAPAEAPQVPNVEPTEVKEENNAVKPNVR